MNHIETARAALLKIWPDGVNCSHAHAREAFAALETLHDEMRNLTNGLYAAAEQRDAINAKLDSEMATSAALREELCSANQERGAAISRALNAERSLGIIAKANNSAVCDMADMRDEARKERDAAIAERDRLRIEASNHAHDAEVVRRERDAAERRIAQATSPEAVERAVIAGKDEYERVIKQYDDAGVEWSNDQYVDAENKAYRAAITAALGGAQ